MKNKLLMLVLVFGFSGTAGATLIDRGSGLIYDDVLDITWLSDANMGGSMNWDDSVAWADSLMFGGFDDWRLPSMDVNGDHMPTGAFDNGIVDCTTASEMACRDNELGYMFYQNLGGSLFDDLTGNQGLIQNLQSVHWSGTEFAPNPSSAWDFAFDGGSQGVGGKLGNFAAWAVRPGDVLTAVPEPGTLALVGLGLAGIGWARRRERSGLK